MFRVRTIMMPCVSPAQPIEKLGAPVQMRKNSEEAFPVHEGAAGDAGTLSPKPGEKRAAAGNPPHRHARRARRHDPRKTVLDDQARRGRDTHPPCREKEK